MASYLSQRVQSLFEFVFPGECLDEMLFKLNIFHPRCTSLVLSRGLGLGITVASVLLFVPQIVKIHMARSGKGVSLPSQLLGLLACFGTFAYSYANNFVFSQWGDSLFIFIQMIVVVMQILYFDSMIIAAFGFLALCSLAVLALIYQLIPLHILTLLQASTIFIVAVAKVFSLLDVLHEYLRLSKKLETWYWMARVIAYFKSIPSRTSEYLKSLASDYKTAVVDVVKDGRAKPVKAAMCSAVLVGLAYAYKTNPTERDVLNEFVKKRQLLVTLPNTIHKREADEALRLRTDFLNQNSLQYIDCFFFSLLLKLPYDKDVRIYESQDKNIRNWWFKEIYQNLIDVGAFGKWYRLRECFSNYDINNEELQDLPDDKKP
uniref:Mannose-P-dolichol utilization defect 1 protein homolog n=1 Tax=Syphacia muris TaxID=451379 RepID=A0A0N5AL18_9BILA